MNILKAAEQVLIEAGEPLHYSEIMKCMLEQQLWVTQGETPNQTLNARLSMDLKDNGSKSLFQRIDRGVYALRSWGLSESVEIIEPDDQLKISKVMSSDSPAHVEDWHSGRILSFTDAAEYVLNQFGGRQSMHYRDVTTKALELGLIKTSGKTPEATLYAQVLTEITRLTRRGEKPRFVKEGRGRISLAHWASTGLVSQIEQHNQNVRQRLYAQLQNMPPADFEELVGELLGALGFAEVEVTKYSNDNGVDVRGILVVGDVIRLSMAVQAKRWKNNIQSPIVQQVRGSLGTHEQGLIITTSDFSEGARREAARSNAVPVALMNGEQLVALLVEHDINVHRTSYDLIELGEDKDDERSQHI